MEDEKNTRLGAIAIPGEGRAREYARFIRATIKRRMRARGEPDVAAMLDDMLQLVEYYEYECPFTPEEIDEYSDGPGLDGDEDRVYGLDPRLFVGGLNGLSDRARIAYAIIADLVGRDHRTDARVAIGTPELGRALGCSASTAAASLRELSGAGLVFGGPTARGRTTEYRVAALDGKEPGAIHGFTLRLASSGLSPSAVVVYAVLRTAFDRIGFLDGKGRPCAFLAPEDMAALLGRGVDSVLSSLDALAGAGLVELETRGPGPCRVIRLEAADAFG
jgi:hypothetical protein